MTSSPPRPNFLVIMADQHSPHVLGCAGDPVVRTPNLDALAARGVRFENTYCAFPLCVPSRMSFMSAQAPSAIRVWSNGCTLASDIPTFAHSLGAAGYETVLCGRMHFNGPDQHRGFTRRLVGDLARSFPGGASRNLGHIPSITTSQVAQSTAIAGRGRTAYEGFDNAVTDAAIDYLRERPPDGVSQDPFCLVVGLVLPHNPYICDPALFDEYYDKVGVPSIPPGYEETLHPAMQTWRRRRGVDTLTEAQHRTARAAYYGLTTTHDRNVGRIFGALEASGLADDTVVVYTSDHGDMAGELGMWWKSSMYEGSVGVPLIWSLPDRLHASTGATNGRTLSTLASLIDIGPTLIDLAGAPPLPHAGGRSLLPWLRGETPSNWVDEVYAEMNAAFDVPPIRMVRQGPWKLVHFHGYETPQLFNLDEDPHELNDRGSDAAVAHIRDALHAKALAGWSAEAMEAALERRARDHAVLVQWTRTQQPHDPTLWTTDPSYNVFPAEQQA
jgi:choline-sulfatase